jgi:hypothetical protein
MMRILHGLYRLLGCRHHRSMDVVFQNEDGMAFECRKCGHTRFMAISEDGPIFEEAA